MPSRATHHTHIAHQHQHQHPHTTTQHSTTKHKTRNAHSTHTLNTTTTTRRLGSRVAHSSGATQGHTCVLCACACFQDPSGQPCRQHATLGAPQRGGDGSDASARFCVTSGWRSRWLWRRQGTTPQGDRRPPRPSVRWRSR